MWSQWTGLDRLVLFFARYGGRVDVDEDEELEVGDGFYSIVQ